MWNFAVLPCLLAGDVESRGIRIQTGMLPPPPPRRNAGPLHVCTGGGQYKAQKQNGLVSGLSDHRSRSVKRGRHEDARGQSTERTKAEAMQRNVVTTAKRHLPDLTANSLWSSLISGIPPPPTHTHTHTCVHPPPAHPPPPPHTPVRTRPRTRLRPGDRAFSLSRPDAPAAALALRASASARIAATNTRMSASSTKTGAPNPFSSNPCCTCGGGGVHAVRARHVRRPLHRGTRDWDRGT